MSEVKDQLSLRERGDAQQQDLKIPGAVAVRIDKESSVESVARELCAGLSGGPGESGVACKAAGEGFDVDQVIRECEIGDDIAAVSPHAAFTCTGIKENIVPKTTCQLVLSAAKGTDLNREPWYHGPVSRKDAEVLLEHVRHDCKHSCKQTSSKNDVLQDGDFLVRESQGSPGQYVLTGMHGNSRKHLLLVDPKGVVSSVVYEKALA